MRPKNPALNGGIFFVQNLGEHDLHCGITHESIRSISSSV